MFQTPAPGPATPPQPQQATSRPAEHSGAPPIAGSPADPGEFTRLLRNPMAPRSDQLFSQTPIAPPPASNQPGEFTRMLEVPQPRSTPQGPAQPMFPKSPGAGPQEPGEFTRMMESPFAAKGLAGQAPAAPPPRPVPTGEATRAFQVHQPPPAPAVPAGEPPAQQGPSEFTRMFKAAPEPPPEVETPARKVSRRPPVVKKQKSKAWIWIVVAIVLALALVLFFALSN